MFPCAELAEDTVERHLRIVRRKRNESAARHRQLLRQLSVQTYGEKRANEIVERSHARTENDQRLGVFPCHHDVVWTHAVRNIVAAQSGRSCEEFRDAALGWHRVNLPVAGVLRSKRDLLSIR